MPALHLSIPSPCHENWQQMVPQDRGRHCSSCQKIVVDFTNMSDQEVLTYMQQATSSVCGRFHNHQLNKSYRTEKPKRSFAFAYGWSVLAGALLLSGQPASAQSGDYMLGEVMPTTIKADKPFWSISHAINKPSLQEMALRYAAKQPPVEVLIGTTGVVMTEYAVTGGISIVAYQGIPESCVVGKPALEVVDTIRQFLVTDTAGTINTDSLIVRDIELEEVVSEHNSAAVLVDDASWVGEVAVVVEESPVELAKKTISGWLPGNKSITLYPNPVAGGGTVTVSLKLKQRGQYKLELLDAAGRQVHVQALQVVQSPQALTLVTRSFWSHGVYWMRITSQHEKEVYQSKLVIQ
ncbi:T9SS type A sorting domain-containing protein [Paraflavitalea pollutisoli]|uniref:T9SS type A sorting domain-containing protein n=1 Tax=Paraflavitalea pollutisoli TaxID=3034143 RepID=UPI0023EB2BDD|nr:T9SS type A sorting domain-containing protein [Paraflavitalea sp. H1-2-19X]